MTRFPEFFAELTAPFGAGEVKHRDQKGRSLAYITARSVQNRLDQVVGPEGWTARYEQWSEDAVLCHLTITLPDGTRLMKSDVGSYSRLGEIANAEPGDDDKGGFSDAFKRAAVCFGIGRHLYGDGVPSYSATAAPGPVVESSTNGHTPAPTPAPEPLPGEAYQRRNRTLDATPTDGRSLYRWAKDVTPYAKFDVIKHLNCAGKLRGFAARIVDWAPSEVAVGVRDVKEVIARQAEPVNA